MRRQQNVELSVFSDGKAGQILAWLRDRILPVHIPGVIAADDKVLLLVTLERSATATARGIVSLPAGEFFPRVTGIVVDSARVSGHLETRPIVLGTEVLTNGSIPAGSGILDGSHVVRTHRFRDCGYNGFRILCLDANRPDSNNYGKRAKRKICSPHCSSIF